VVYFVGEKITCAGGGKIGIPEKVSNPLTVMAGEGCRYLKQKENKENVRPQKRRLTRNNLIGGSRGEKEEQETLNQLVRGRRRRLDTILHKVLPSCDQLLLRGEKK